MRWCLCGRSRCLEDVLDYILSEDNKTKINLRSNRRFRAVDSTAILTKCLWRHLRLLRNLRQNSQRYRMGSEVSSCGYGEKYQGFNRWRPNSIHSMFFMRVTMSSWLRSDTRLPVMRGADGMPSELSWESWWNTARTLDSRGRYWTLWISTHFDLQREKIVWSKLYKSSKLSFLLDPLRHSWHTLDSKTHSMGNNRK